MALLQLERTFCWLERSRVERFEYYANWGGDQRFEKNFMLINYYLFLAEAASKEVLL